MFWRNSARYPCESLYNSHIKVPNSLLVTFSPGLLFPWLPWHHPLSFASNSVEVPSLVSSAGSFFSSFKLQCVHIIKHTFLHRIHKKATELINLNIIIPFDLGTKISDNLWLFWYRRSTELGLHCLAHLKQMSMGMTQ